MIAKWILGIWFTCCLTGLLFMSVKQLVEFDPTSKLAIAISDTSFELTLTKELEQAFGDINYTMIHFSASGCFCGTLSTPHIKQLSNEMQSQGFRNIQVDLDEYSELSHYIPATPSVAIIGDKNELVYLGPYSEGYGCLSGTGLVDNLLPKINSNTIENALLITDAKGCYCTT